MTSKAAPRRRSPPTRSPASWAFSTWRTAASDSPDELRSLWQDAVARSGVLVAEALANGDLDQLARHGWPDGRSPSLRWILLHMIEEYSRHNGHADLIREAIDGSAGE